MAAQANDAGPSRVVFDHDVHWNACLKLVGWQPKQMMK
jgi:hypothetical protein